MEKKRNIFADPWAMPSNHIVTIAEIRSIIVKNDDESPRVVVMLEHPIKIYFRNADIDESSYECEPVYLDCDRHSEDGFWDIMRQLESRTLDILLYKASGLPIGDDMTNQELYRCIFGEYEGDFNPNSNPE